MVEWSNDPKVPRACSRGLEFFSLGLLINREAMASDSSDSSMTSSSSPSSGPQRIETKVVYQKVFEPWAIPRIRAAVARIKQHVADGTEDDFDDELKDFEAHHPKLVKILRSGDSFKQSMVEELIGLRSKEERGMISEAAVGKRILEIGDTMRARAAASESQKAQKAQQQHEADRVCRIEEP